LVQEALLTCSYSEGIALKLSMIVVETISRLAIVGWADAVLPASASRTRFAAPNFSAVPISCGCTHMSTIGALPAARATKICCSTRPNRTRVSAIFHCTNEERVAGVSKMTPVLHNARIMLAIMWQAGVKMRSYGITAEPEARFNP